MTTPIEKIEEELMDKISDLRFDGDARNRNLFLIKTELHDALTRVREEAFAEGYADGLGKGIEEESFKCHEHCEKARKDVLQEVRDRAEGMKRGGAYLVSPITQKNVDKRDNYFFNLALSDIISTLKQ